MRLTECSCSSRRSPPSSLVAVSGQRRPVAPGADRGCLCARADGRPPGLAEPRARPAPRGAYVPAQLRDGHIVPGHAAPQ